MQRSLSLPLTVGLLALAVSVSATQAQAQTKSDSDDIYVMVTTAIHQHSAETALPVTVVTGEELHKTVRATLGDTLSAQPGISNASFGPAVGQTVIRGQQGRRVMNLSNSMPNADASGNSADHAQTTEPLLATSIEVLRGPATLLYGGGAIGGVVNVLDRRIATTIPAQPEFAVETRYDSAANLHNTVASTDFATANLVWHLDGVKRDWNDQNIPGPAIDPLVLARVRAKAAANGEPVDPDSGTLGKLANSGGETTSGTAGLSWVFDSGHLGFAYNHLDNFYGLPPGVPGESEEANIAISMQRSRYDLSGEWRAPLRGLQKVTYNLSHTDYQHVELEDGATGTRFTNDSWQHRLQVTLEEFHGWHGVIGGQHSQETFAAIGEESFIPVSDIHGNGVFVVEDFHTAALTFEMGGRLNRDAYEPESGAAPARDFTTHSLSGSVLWQHSDPFTIGLSVARSERAPSVEELYSNIGLADIDDCVIHHANGGCEIGNSNFKREQSLNTDLTFAWHFDKVKATVTVFDNRFNDYIAQINDGREVEGLPVRLYTQDDAHFHGVEVDVEWKLTEQYRLRLFGDSMRGTLETHGDMPRLPPRRYGMELNFARAAWTAYASLQHAVAQQHPGALEQESGSWNRLEIGADYTISLGDNKGELLLFAKGRNLLDDTIRLSTSYLRSVAPEAGRSIETGIRYRF